jgi:hypothetical protein
MTVRYQLTIDCASPAPLAEFWAAALHYVASPPPQGFGSWDDFYRSIGVPDHELDGSADRIEDPNGEGPPIWFQIVPEPKTIKNRIHFDINASGGRGEPWDVRRERVEAEAARLEALGATRLRTSDDPDNGHYAVAMADPEGNEVDVF